MFVHRPFVILNVNTPFDSIESQLNLIIICNSVPFEADKNVKYFISIYCVFQTNWYIKYSIFLITWLIKVIVKIYYSYVYFTHPTIVFNIYGNDKFDKLI